MAKTGNAVGSEYLAYVAETYRMRNVRRNIRIKRERAVNEYAFDLLGMASSLDAAPRLPMEWACMACGAEEQPDGEAWRNGLQACNFASHEGLFIIGEQNLMRRLLTKKQAGSAVFAGNLLDLQGLYIWEACKRLGTASAIVSRRSEKEEI